MIPPGHAAVGYALFSLTQRLRREQPPTETSTLWLLVGTQFPDLIDKPLAWGVGVLPTGRSLAHSLLVAVPVCVFVWFRFRRHDRLAVLGFVIGYASHLLADVAISIENGLHRITFLAWPLLPLPMYESEMPAWPPQLHLLSVKAVFILLLCGLVVLLWIDDGHPGLGVVRSLLARVNNR